MNKTRMWHLPVLSHYLATASPILTVVLKLMTLFKETKLSQYDFFIHRVYKNKARMGLDIK